MFFTGAKKESSIIFTFSLLFFLATRSHFTHSFCHYIYFLIDDEPITRNNIQEKSQLYKRYRKERTSAQSERTILSPVFFKYLFFPLQNTSAHFTYIVLFILYMLNSMQCSTLCWLLLWIWKWHTFKE